MKITLGLLLVLIVGAVAVWWLMDHDRGVRWAQSFVRARFPDVAQISPRDLEAWLHDPTRPKPQLLDVRTLEEQNLSTLPGAHCVAPEATAESALKGLDRTKPLVVYCAAGYRACIMAQRLKQAGCTDVRNLDGGVFAWGNKWYHLEKDGQRTTEVHSYSPLFSRMVKNPKP